MTTEEFDVVVIGGGPPGENAAQYAVEGTGLTCALVEAERVGGECSFWACMPSKALLRPIEVANATNDLEGIENTRVIPEDLLARRDIWRSQLDDASQVAWAESAGLTVVRGFGRLSAPRTVEVTGEAGSRTLRARRAVVLAAGSVAAIPDTLSGIAPWTSRDATGVQEVPASIAIIGGGVVACEAATWLAALGSRVTMLIRGDRLLPRSEPMASDAVAAGLRARGVDIRFGAILGSASRASVYDRPEVGRVHGGLVSLGLDGEHLEFAEVLVATGRRLAVAGLGLEKVGLSPRDFDGRVDLLDGWLYAVGDISGGPQLTHWGKYQGRVVGELIAARAQGGPQPAAPPVGPLAPVPSVVFTDPQVAQVGPTAEAARRAGRDVRVVDLPMNSAAGYSLLRDDSAGAARLVLDGDRILSATFVGHDVAELLHTATVAITGEVSLNSLRRAVPAYPTASEVWLRLVEAAVR
ncbi:MAG: NAD(P)/FAD-dependent oxidoreductase [Propionibacteriaceae bacterium]|nr:NAD(P)/FAD-dependent oxidoreductase [Propionibacteriaceae bacterium]